MNRIYWFKRKKDDKYIPIDNKQTAGRMVKDRNFDRNWEYIGWSDGSKFKEIMDPHLIKNSPDEWKNQLTRDKRKKRLELTKRAYTAEIMMAKNNPDKAMPVYENIVVMGNKSQEASIKQMLRAQG